MPISMRCPGCQTRFDFADDLDGKRVKCKSCGDIFRIAAPAPVKKVRVDDDPDDDRPRVRRRDDDEDDDRPASRSRRPVRDDDDDDRPARSRSRDDDSDDDLPRRRRDEDDDEDFRSKKKRLNPLVWILPVAFVGLLVAVVVVVLVFRGGKKKSGAGDPGDLVLAPTKSCPLDVPEKDAGYLVLPDGGNTFGLIRKLDPSKRAWVFDPYDLAAGRRVGSIELTGVTDPKAYALSPDGKKLLITEIDGIGWAGDQSLRLWSIPDNKQITQDRWIPFPKVEKNPFDAPALYRAEFIANDRILALGNRRSFYIYQLPSFEVSAGQGTVADKEPLGKQIGMTPSNFHQIQWQAAFSANRQKMAVWTGDGYEIIGTADGVRQSITPSVKALAKKEWAGEAFLDRVAAGPVAFSPDGNTLAAILTHDFGRKRHLLCLWDTRETKDPIVTPIAENQLYDSSSVHWWGNKFVVTHGGMTEGMLIDVRTGLPRRQLMGPVNKHYGFSRDGKLWYAASEERTKPGTMHVVDALDPDQLKEPDDYEQILDLGQEFYLRRLWLEPTGVLRQPTRDDPPTKQRLIRRP
ncbi:MAG TPA: MJ0042-type zinc finger domain-containing protein [Gemmataceae bacterium]|jgi:predicted Zn finger-like uncharacterized protein|nr:MJ0042-type zinc finger domain-containing protein [Gemmataceae bacterium]